MVSQLQFDWVRIEKELFFKVWMIVFANEVFQQSQRHDEREVSVIIEGYDFNPSDFSSAVSSFLK